MVYFRSTICQSIKELFVSTVTVSSKYQVVIPKDVRDRLGIKPGQKVEAFAVGGRIEFVPVRPIHELRGLMRGLQASFEREPDREF
jgi:AbrB family looped-hinge helix DNA binding protein